MNKSTEIQMIARSLSEDLLKLESQLNSKRALLDAIGNVCEHPTVEKYRGREIGICEFCLRKFMTRSNVDQLFVE